MCSVDPYINTTFILNRRFSAKRFEKSKLICAQFLTYLSPMHKNVLRVPNVASELTYVCNFIFTSLQEQQMPHYYLYYFFVLSVRNKHRNI
jgi:hypothetical protein